MVLYFEKDMRETDFICTCDDADMSKVSRNDGMSYILCLQCQRCDCALKSSLK